MRIVELFGIGRRGANRFLEQGGIEGVSRIGRERLLPRGSTVKLPSRSYPSRPNSRAKVLVAVEPRTYSSVIGTAVGELRPDLDVRVVDPEELEEEVEHLCPCLVLCSRTEDQAGRGGVPGWVEYRPYAEPPRVTMRLGGRRSTLEEIDLEDLLSVVDAASRSAGDAIP